MGAAAATGVHDDAAEAAPREPAAEEREVEKAEGARRQQQQQQQVSVSGGVGAQEGAPSPALAAALSLLHRRKLNKSQYDEGDGLLPRAAIRDALEDHCDILRTQLLATVRAHEAAKRAAAPPSSPSSTPPSQAVDTARAGGRRKTRQQQALVGGGAVKLRPLLPRAAASGLLARPGSAIAAVSSVSLEDLIALGGLAEVRAPPPAMADTARDGQRVSARSLWAQPYAHLVLPRPLFALSPQLSQLYPRPPLLHEAAPETAAHKWQRLRRQQQQQQQQREAAETAAEAAADAAAEASDVAAAPARHVVEEAGAHAHAHLEPAGPEEEMLPAPEPETATGMAASSGLHVERLGSQEWLAVSEGQPKPLLSAPEPSAVQAMLEEVPAVEAEQQLPLLLPPSQRGPGVVPQLQQAEPLSVSEVQGMLGRVGVAADAVQVLTTRPLQVAAVYKSALGATPAASAVLGQYTQGASRLAAARWFTDSLVLMNVGLTQMRQEEAFGDIHVALRAAAVY